MTMYLFNIGEYEIRETSMKLSFHKSLISNFLMNKCQLYKINKINKY